MNRWIFKNKRINLLEVKLAEQLRPITPSPEFVQALRTKLVGQIEKAEERILGIPRKTFQTGLLVVSGIASAIVFGLAIARSLLTFFGLLGLLNRNKKALPSPTSL